MDKKTDMNALVPLGLGVALGGSALWLLVELWPLLIIGGGAALLLKGMGSETTPNKESK